MDDGSFGGYLWLVIDVIFVVALAAALVYGMMRWRRGRLTRREKIDQREAVDKMYHPDRPHPRNPGAGR